MPLAQLVVVLIVVGVLLWLINRYIPMQGTIKSILNAVVVIVVRRYARLVVVAKIGSPSSSIVTMITDHSSQATSVTVKYFYLSKGGCVSFFVA